MTTSTPQQAKSRKQLQQQVYHYLKKKKKKLNFHCRSSQDRKKVEYSSILLTIWNYRLAVM